MRKQPVGIEFMVFRENGRCIIRDRKGRKFGDFGDWDVANDRADELNRTAAEMDATCKWLGL